VKGKALMRTGGIILCGGRSTRMGRDKASLPFAGEPMLLRVLRQVQVGLGDGPVVIVASSTQELPPLPETVRIVRDQRPDQGPLEGLATGLQELVDVVDVAFVTSCDVPLLNPAVIRLLLDKCMSWDVVVPQDEHYPHPLCAVYRTSTLTSIRRLLEAGEHRPRALFQQVCTCFLSVDVLRTVDPQLLSLLNLNHPAEYERALALAGMENSVESSEQ
jgi:molybdopterin-guanine dinucleotide biosynthesis protein A